MDISALYYNLINIEFINIQNNIITLIIFYFIFIIFTILAKIIISSYSFSQNTIRSMPYCFIENIFISITKTKFINLFTFKKLYAIT